MVKGTGEKGRGMVIWAATAVTAAIRAVRDIIATFKSFSLLGSRAPTTTKIH
jgi:hypothetical protein